MAGELSVSSAWATILAKPTPGLPAHGEGGRADVTARYASTFYVLRSEIPCADCATINSRMYTDAGTLPDLRNARMTLTSVGSAFTSLPASVPEASTAGAR